nr:PH domain-containing protein [Galbitalea soli]
MHTFRITDEIVEVRSGVLFRTNRKGRLDRIQGVNIVRPVFARLFGAARLEIDVAGHDANVRLDYLSSSNADALRLDILRMASGLRRREAAAGGVVPGGAVAASTGPAGLAAPVPGTAIDGAAAPGSGGGSFLEDRLNEFLAPELDPRLAPPESVVTLHLGRLLGSIVLHDTTLVFAVILIGVIVESSLTGHLFIAFTFIPFLFGLGSFIVRRFTRSLRYSIAATPDGVRVGFGLLTLSNETLPPGRIHSVQIRQPILWRLPGWWEIRVNRASKSAAKGADGQRNTTILPVGNLDEVLRVLGLLLPGLSDADAALQLRAGITGSGEAAGFTVSPPRARVVRWFSRRRNGWAFGPAAILLRRGAIWRSLTVVPEPRVQSVALRQGPLYRRLSLAHLDVHTVTGPIRAELGALDAADATRLFTELSDAVVTTIANDATHRWRSGEVPA